MYTKKLSSEFEVGWISAFLEIKGVFTVNKIIIRRITKKGEKTYTYNNPVFYADSTDPTPLEIAGKVMGIGRVVKREGFYRLEIRKKKELIKFAVFLSRCAFSGSKAEKIEKWRESVLQWKSRGLR